MLKFSEWKKLQKFDPRPPDELLEQISDYLMGIRSYEEAELEIPISDLPLRPEIKRIVYDKMKREGWPHVEWDEDDRTVLVLKDLHKDPEI
jgi:hypothetical protein